MASTGLRSIGLYLNHLSHSYHGCRKQWSSPFPKAVALCLIQLMKQSVVGKRGIHTRRSQRESLIRFHWQRNCPVVSLYFILSSDAWNIIHNEAFMYNDWVCDWRALMPLVIGITGIESLSWNYMMVIYYSAVSVFMATVAEFRAVISLQTWPLHWMRTELDFVV